jgi:eukaryotic-like serine/threonine-protein kinase
MRLGRYELALRLARGGMAEVFLARQAGPAGFEKMVAVKRILPHLSRSPEFVQMFLDEARIAALLDHPHITHVYDVGEADGLYYLAMEYVAGEDLGEIMARARQRRQEVPAGVAATILLAACDALHYAHYMHGADGRWLRIVHRDVTPSNILVTYDGTVKIGDFGIAKAELRAGVDDSGVLRGKGAYMAPEQARAEEVDARADIFALGVCAWELVTGRRLFHRESELGLAGVLDTEPVPRLVSLRPDFPAELARVIERALERDPAKRWPTAQKMQLAVETWLAAAGTAPSKITLAGWLRSLMGEEHAQRRERLAQALPEPREITLPLPPPPSARTTPASPAAPFRQRALAALDGLPWPDLGGSRRMRVVMAALLTAIAVLIAWFLHPLHRTAPAGSPPHAAQRIDSTVQGALSAPPEMAATRALASASMAAGSPYAPSVMRRRSPSALST